MGYKILWWMLLLAITTYGGYERYAIRRGFRRMKRKYRRLLKGIAKFKRDYRAWRRKFL